MRFPKTLRHLRKVEFMKLKKILASTLTGAMLLTAAPIISSTFDINISTVEAAKGGAKLSIPKTSTPKPNLNKTPESNKTPAANESKSVSGGGKEYTPSKSGKDLQSTAPSAKSSATNSGTGFGNTLRNIGIFAGGMLLGSMIVSLFGGFGGIFGDILGVLFNVIMIYAAYKGIKFLYNKFRGNNNQAQTQQQYQTQTKSQDFNQPIDITPPQASNYPNKSTIGMDYDPKRAADQYRNL